MEYFEYKYQKYRSKYSRLSRLVRQMGGDLDGLKQARQVVVVFDYDDTLRSQFGLGPTPEDWHIDVTEENNIKTAVEFFRLWKRQTGLPIVLFSAGTLVYDQLVEPLGRVGFRVSLNSFSREADLVLFYPGRAGQRLGGRGYYRADPQQLAEHCRRIARIWGQEDRSRATLLNGFLPIDNYVIAPFPEDQRQLVGHVVVEVDPDLDARNGVAIDLMPGIAPPGSTEVYIFKDLSALKHHLSFRLKCLPSEIGLVFFDDRYDHYGLSPDIDLYVSSKLLRSEEADRSKIEFTYGVTNILREVTKRAGFGSPRPDRIDIEGPVKARTIAEMIHREMDYPHSLMVGKTPVRAPAELDPPDEALASDLPVLTKRSLGQALEELFGHQQEHQPVSDARGPSPKRRRFKPRMLTKDREEPDSR
jgi:hypothetical protein